MRASLFAWTAFSLLMACCNAVVYGQRKETSLDSPPKEQKVQSESTDFVPANERERALLRMIQELQREVKQLRQQLNGLPARDTQSDLRPVRESDVPRRVDSVQRDSGQPSAEGRRDAGRRDPTLKRTSIDSRVFNQAKRIFAAYDKNKDGFASFEEWLKMREGKMTAERKARERTHFSDPAGEDGKISQEEFYRWMLSRQRGKASPDGGQRESARRDAASSSRTESSNAEGRRDRPVERDHPVQRDPRD